MDYLLFEKKKKSLRCRKSHICTLQFLFLLVCQQSSMLNFFLMHLPPISWLEFNVTFSCLLRPK